MLETSSLQVSTLMLLVGNNKDWTFFAIVLVTGMHSLQT